MRQIVLLRGINIGARRRVAMPALRERLTDAGLSGVRTYVQSGSVVLDSDLSPEQLARECERQIAEGFGFDVAVTVRTRDQLAEVVERNPLGEVASDPKRYQVSFLSAELDPETIAELGSVAVGSEQFVAIGRELYAWHPDGVARSKLWNKLAGQGLGARARSGSMSGSGVGVTATARNWATVTKLLEMADE